MYLITLALTLMGLAHAERPLIPTGPFHARRAIYCSGTRAAFTYSRVEAVCVDPRRFRVYRLTVIGLGGSFQLAGTVFRVALDYDVTRYDAKFDPFPGEYFAQLTGFALGAGVTELVGSAGNKVLRGQAWNVGLGIDNTLAALLIIR